MANRYADSRNGNDSNDGLSWANAKKTLAASNTAASAGDVINAVGVFIESVSFTKTLTLTAVGFCVLDGQSVLATGLTISGQVVTMNGVWLKNYSTNGVTSTSNATVTCNDCAFSSCPAGFSHTSSGDNSITINRCIFRNCSTAGLSQNNAATATVTNCTFVGCGTGYLWASATSTLHPRNCIFRTNTTHIAVGTAGAYHSSANYNCIDFSSGNCKIGATPYTTMADWRTAVGGSKDANSISVDPQFVDQAKNLYMLKPASACLVNGSLAFGSIQQGAWINPEGSKGSEAWSANSDPGSAWSTKTLSNCEVDGSGNIVLSANQYTVTATFLRNFGAQRKIRRINFGQTFSWPTSFLDYDTADVRPETWEYRYRTSADGTPPAGGWTEASWLSDLNLSGVQQIEVEVTLKKVS